MTRRHFSSLSSPSVCFYLHVCVVEFLIFDIDTLMNTKYSDKCLVSKKDLSRIFGKQIVSTHSTWNLDTWWPVLLGAFSKYCLDWYGNWGSPEYGVWSVVHGSVIKTFLHHWWLRLRRVNGRKWSASQRSTLQPTQPSSRCKGAKDGPTIKT